MNIDKRFFHHSHYVIEIVILFSGFMLVGIGGFSLQIELVFMALTLALYATVGMLHHHIHHDLTSKIMLEYALLTTLLFVIYFFVNSNKL